MIDISVPVRPGMVVFEGDSEVRLEATLSLARGDDAELSTLTLSVHAGTHIDAPSHFIEGAPGAESIPLARLLGPARVVDATSVEKRLDADALERLSIPRDVTRVLFRTRNSDLWDRATFTREYVGLTQDAARVLVERGVELVGIDYLSVATHAELVPVHRVLLGAAVVVLEGLDLRRAEPGTYELVCLPLRLDGAEAAPARAVLLSPPGW